MRPVSLPSCLALALACQGYQFEEVTPRFIGAKTESHTVPSEKLAPNLMLVVDRSGSMKQAADGSGQCCTLNGSMNGEYDPASPVACKWNDLKHLLGSQDGFLATNASTVNFGLVLFAGDASCTEGSVRSYLGEDGEAAASAAAVARLINDEKPAGGTPTAKSLKHVMDDSRMRIAEAGRDRFVMLLTDGAPNCNDANEALCRACLDDPTVCYQAGQCKPTDPCDAAFMGSGCLDENETVAQVQKLADAGIRTFVIGFGAATKDPGSDAYRVLEAAAQAGGLARAEEPRFYQANSQEELSKALAELLVVVRQCKYELSPPPERPELLEVAFVYDDGREVVLAPPAPESSGDWEWDADHRLVKVTGKRCEEIQSGPKGLSVVVRYVVGL